MKKSKIVGTIISAIIVVVGVFIVVYNAVIVYNADLKNITYKNIEASVSTVQSTYVDGVQYYKATYVFNIDGTNYACNSNYTGDKDEYVVGEKGIVRYDPNMPSNCYLVEDNKIWNYLYLGISSIVLIFGIKMFDRFIRVK